MPTELSHLGSTPPLPPRASWRGRSPGCQPGSPPSWRRTTRGKKKVQMNGLQFMMELFWCACFTGMGSPPPSSACLFLLKGREEEMSTANRQRRNSKERGLIFWWGKRGGGGGERKRQVGAPIGDCEVRRRRRLATERRRGAGRAILGLCEFRTPSWKKSKGEGLRAQLRQQNEIPGP